MQKRTVFCPSCGRSVVHVATDAPLHGESQATLPDVQTICLDSGGQCADGNCPVTGLSATTMKQRLETTRIEGAPHPVQHVVHADFLE